MRQKFFTLLLGMVLGMALLSGGYAAANTVLTATPSAQAFYIDGKQMTMTAYLIGGSNYVRLRDVGEAVGFNVYWDGNSVQIESDKPYTGVAPTSQASQPVQQTTAALTEENVQATIRALRDIYPTNTPYGAPYVSSSNGPYGVSNTNCAGWAVKCSDIAFGSLPWRRIERPNWDQIRAGDLIEYADGANHHVVVVLDRTDDYIKVTESGLNNKVRWGGQYFKWWLEEQPNYILYTRYPA